MNKFYKFLFVFLLTVGCGFKPIFVNKKVNFGIDNLVYDKKNKVDISINKKLKNYRNLENKEKILDLEISSNIDKVVTSLDDRGDAKSFRLEIEVSTIVKKNNNTKYQKIFNKSQNYNNSTNKFDLKKYENSIKENLINKITEEIIVFILALEI